MNAPLVHDPFGRSFLENSQGARWLGREPSPHVVLVSETGTRRLARLPQAWEHLSPVELEQYCRAAQTV